MRIERCVRRKTWTTAAALAAIACATSSAFARTKHDDDPSDPRDPPDKGDTGPIDHPHHDPEQKPQIPGYVLSNSVYYRETTLPLCEWGSGARSFFQFFYPNQEQQDAQEPADWACFTSWQPDTCTFTAGPDPRPTNASYAVAPRAHYGANLQWPDGSTAHNVWSIGCAASSAAGSSADTVVGSTFEGDPWGGTMCTFAPPWPQSRKTLLAELVGGDVEHIRPALVRAQLFAGYYADAGARNISGDLVLALQVFGDQGWTDFKTITRTTGPQPAFYELEATVPAGSAVRFQLRGTQLCGDQYGDGYDIRSMRILVETCIPDQNNPGSCL
jgi:hypothetical protein